MSHNVGLVESMKSHLPIIYTPSPPCHIRYGIIPGRPFYIIRDSRPLDESDLIRPKDVDGPLESLIRSVSSAIAGYVAQHPTLERYDYTPPEYVIKGTSRIAAGMYAKPERVNYSTKVSIVVYLIVPIPGPVIH